jgi:hypothetical protein
MSTIGVLPVRRFFKVPALNRGFWVRLTGSLLAAHVIETLGREESILTMLTQRFYYVDVGSGFVIAFVVWTALALANRWLDRHFDWDEHPVPRVFLQIVLAVVLPALLVHFLTYLQAVFIVENSTFFTPSWPQYEFPVCIMIILLINAYYLTYHYYQKAKAAKQNAPSPVTNQERPMPSLPEAGQEEALGTETTGKKNKQVVLITKGYKTFPLPLNKVAYFYREGQHNYVKTFENEVHFLNSSLDDLTASLDESLFFKVNRRTIVNFHACCFYSVLEHGKLELTLKPESDQCITISQKMAPAFKEWLDR